MNEDVSQFVSNCIHCVMSKSGQKVPRPLSLTLHATKPNEVVHFDFLYLGQSFGEMRYVLVLKDDLSSYVWLTTCESATSEVAAREISRWIHTFTPMYIWVSDQGSHFKNRVMQHLANEHHIRHNFTVAYSPWINGTVENVNRHIRAACTALLTELKLAPQDWPNVIPLVASILNEAPLSRLGKSTSGGTRTPLEVMTSLLPRRNVLITGVPGTSTLTLDRIRAEQLVSINKLQTAVEQMHKETSNRVTTARQKQIQAHNKQTNIIQPNFSLGDFVLVRRAQDKGHKLNFRWFGPRRIVHVYSDLVYDVAKLNGSDVEQVHCARLILYRHASENSVVSKELLDLADRSEAQYELVEKIIAIGEEHYGIFLQVQWLGLPDAIDYTWVSLKTLFEDMPDFVTEFLNSHKKNKTLIKNAKQAINLSL